MTFEEAKAILNTCVREELRDHAFGDREIYWTRDGQEIAFGYSGSSVSFGFSGDDTVFSDDEVRELLRCGSLGTVERNDSTGPDTYTDGACMPGLTLAGVREEICRDPDDFTVCPHCGYTMGVYQDSYGRRRCKSCNAEHYE